MADDPAENGTESTDPAALARELAGLKTELGRERNRRQAAESKVTDAENAALAEQGKWKEVAEREKSRADGAEQRLAALEQGRQREQVVSRAARDLKFHDVDIATALLDRQGIAADADEATIRTALEGLAESRPYLVNTTGTPPAPAATPPAGGARSSDDPFITGRPRGQAPPPPTRSAQPAAGPADSADADTRADMARELSSHLRPAGT